MLNSCMLDLGQEDGTRRVDKADSDPSSNAGMHTGICRYSLFGSNSAINAAVFLPLEIMGNLAH